MTTYQTLNMVSKQSSSIFLDEIKTPLHVTDEDHDIELQVYLDVATKLLTKQADYSICETVWEQIADCEDYPIITLWKRPVLSVDKVECLNDDEWIELEDTDYTVTLRRGYTTVYCGYRQVRVTYTTGPIRDDLDVAKQGIANYCKCLFDGTPEDQIPLAQHVVAYLGAS